jgi:biopolymer transport protein ExbD
MMETLVGGRRGAISEVNVVPLIDILLVLLVMFLSIPVHGTGQEAQIPLPGVTDPGRLPVGVGILDVLAEGSFRILQGPTAWEELGARVEENLGSRPKTSGFRSGR